MPSDRLAQVLALAAELTDEERAELAERLRRTVPDALCERVEAIRAAATAPHVLSPSTRRALEKIAEEFARDMRSNEVFRAELREAAIASARELAASLRASRTTEVEERKLPRLNNLLEEGEESCNADDYSMQAIIAELDRETS